MKGLNQLVEMVETEKGYNINKLSPFFLCYHTDELLTKLLFGLQISKEIQKLKESNGIDSVLSIIRESSGEDKAKISLVEQFNISEETTSYILEMSFDEFCALETTDYISLIKIFEEAIHSFKNISAKLNDLETKTNSL